MSTPAEERMIDRILDREGSTFTNISGDLGGATKFGITQKAWTAWRSRLPLVIREELPPNVRNLQPQNAREFYELEYVIPSRWLSSAPLRELFIDCSINHGEHRTVRWVQQIVGVTDDGKIGPITRAAIANANAADVFHALLRRRFKLYAEIASDQNNEAAGIVDPQAKFLRGWINRACEFIGLV